MTEAIIYIICYNPWTLLKHPYSSDKTPLDSYARVAYIPS
jgi:hypothetical protein